MRAELTLAIGLLLALFKSAYAKPPDVVDFRAEFIQIPVTESLSAKKSEGGDASCAWPKSAFSIGKFEVSNTEYVDFLNSVARKGDPHKLFSILQTEHFWGGIVRRVDQGTFVYGVKPGYELLPVTFVSWHDAIRFVNWLHFGRPNTGSSELGTTEGTADVGAYDTRKATLGTGGQRRNRESKYFIPTCGEWLLAGFWDPTADALTKYVGGNETPRSAPPAANERTANYYSGKWALAFPHLAPVNAYKNNSSAVGTLNQAGNVMEWVESEHANDQIALGGSVFMPEDTLRVSYRDSERPGKKLSSFGFRVARTNATNTHFDQPFSAKVMANFMPHSADRKTGPQEGKSQWTLIDHPGNISDIKTGYGCVAQPFEISKTEITNAEYVDFLNSVARKEDPHNLYLKDMTTGIAGGIVKTNGVEGSVYSVKPGYETRPAAYISWFTLARLANWHHFGKPKGNQVLGVTEGDNAAGAYDTRDFDEFTQSGRMHIVPPSKFSRNAGARYFIPSADEWYKAAYYDPARKGFRKYWDYPSRSNTPPQNSKKAPGSANYQIEGLGEGPPYFVSEAGQYKGRGYFDVFDMGGNLWEWVESWRGLGGEKCWRCEVPTKGLRGGSFNYISIGLWNGNTDPGFPSDHYFVYGGRLARTAQTSPDGENWCVPTNIREKSAKAKERLVRHQNKVILAGVTFTCFIGGIFLLKRKILTNRAN